jgi:hypothetical protein
VRTVLVLTGVTSLDDLERYSYQPNEVIGSLTELALE